MSSRRREVLATAFEAVGDRWAYYPNAWSRGVLVSAEERELFLGFRLRLFRKAIAGRPASEPRRPYWPMLKRILCAMLTGRDAKGRAS